MRLVILGLCVLVAVGVFATMFLSIWSTRRGRAGQSLPRQHLAAELVWSAIPCLMIVAAAIPAIMAVAATSPREPPAVPGNSLDAVPLEDRSPVSAGTRLLMDPVDVRGTRGES